MPIFDYICKDCGEVFEYLLIKSDEVPICPICKSLICEKLFTMLPHSRMDADQVLKSLPDPQPPLEELRDCRPGALQDKPHASPYLKDYVRKRDKNGNTEWIEKDKSEHKTQYFT